MDRPRPLERRGVLRAGAVAVASLVAGCSALGGDGDGSGSGRSISYGETVESTLESGDGTDPAHDDLAEPVTFQGEAGDGVTISMESDTIDTYLVLEGPDGSVVAENDDRSAFDTDSRIRAGLGQTGTYTVWAGSFSGTATGEYTLTLERGTFEDGPDLRSIAFGETMEGHVDLYDGTDPRYHHVAEPVTFEAEAGDGVTVTMESGAFDTYIVLAGPDGSVVAENDDGSGMGTDSRLETQLEATGSYTVWAGSLDGQSTGPYTLTLARG